MEIKVVLDRKGNIVSAIYKTPREKEDVAEPSMGPVTEEGQTVVELGVPDTYASLPVSDFVERLHTDVQAKIAKLKKKQKTADLVLFTKTSIFKGFLFQDRKLGGGSLFVKYLHRKYIYLMSPGDEEII